MTTDHLILDPEAVAVHQMATFVVEPRTVSRALQDSPRFTTEVADSVVRVEWTRLPDGEPTNLPPGRITVHAQGILLEAFSEERLRALQREVDAFGAQRATADEVRVLPLDEALRRPARLLHPLEEAEGTVPSARDLAAWFLRSGWPDLPDPALDGRTPRRLLETGRGRAALERHLTDVPDRLKDRWPAFPRFDPDELRHLLLPDEFPTPSDAGARTPGARRD